MITAETANIGRLSDQAAVRRLQLDDVTFTYIVDGAMAMAPQHFLSSVPAEYWAEHPDMLDTSGRIAMSAGGLLVERPVSVSSSTPASAWSPWMRTSAGATAVTS